MIVTQIKKFGRIGKKMHEQIGMNHGMRTHPLNQRYNLEISKIQALKRLRLIAVVLQITPIYGKFTISVLLGSPIF